MNLGLVNFKPGTYKYGSSRDNNFSNRAVKASLSVLDAATEKPEPPMNVRATPIVNEAAPAAAKAIVEWDPPGSGRAYIGTDAKPYWNVEQMKLAPVDYRVERSCNGGVNWIDAGPQCRGGAVNQCEVRDMPAGASCAFRVTAASAGGWSEPSAFAVAKMVDSDTSKACEDQLNHQLAGTYVNSAVVFAAVAVVVILLLCLCFAAIIIRRRTPTPPPGGPGDFKEMEQPYPSHYEATELPD